MVQMAGIEPARFIQPQDFKSCASASSATSAFQLAKMIILLFYISCQYFFIIFLFSFVNIYFLFTNTSFLSMMSVFVFFCQHFFLDFLIYLSVYLKSSKLIKRSFHHGKLLQCTNLTGTFNSS